MTMGARENMRMPTRTHEKKPTTPPVYRIDIVERIDDSPRRRPDLPSLDVGLTIAEPGPQLDGVWDRRRNKNPDRWGVIRYDLMDDRCFDDRLLAKDHQHIVMRRLTRAGHAVNGRSTIYRTYVIELDGSKKPDHHGWLYVGQTSKSFEERLAEHLDPDSRLGSPKVRKNFVRTRLDLAGTNVLFDQGDALMAESRLRVHLEKLGYAVDGGQECYQRALDET